MTVLTVLIGAGASYDCYDRDTGTFGIDDHWRPPLVNELFDPRATFAGVLRHYPKAEALSGEIRLRLRDSKDNQWLPLEQLLKEAANASHLAVRRRYWEVPYYLQELIGEVGARFFQFGRPLYHQLLVDIAEALAVGHYTSVLFLTVNYDLLLDREIELLFDHRFRQMGHYISHNQWKLVKLHGSVNWGFRFAPGIVNDREECLAALSAMVEEPTPQKDGIFILENHQTYCHGGYFIHPAIAVPIAGKSGFLCLDDIANAARENIARSTDFLILGCRMADEDVLDLFGAVAQVNRIKIVDAGLESSLDILHRMADHCRAFRPLNNRGECLSKSGFSDFVTSGELRAFLKG